MTDFTRPLARLALGVLGWTPETFWRATPAELRLALEGRFPGSPADAQALKQEELTALRDRFPDH